MIRALKRAMGSRLLRWAGETHPRPFAAPRRRDVSLRDIASPRAVASFRAATANYLLEGIILVGGPPADDFEHAYPVRVTMLDWIEPGEFGVIVSYIDGKPMLPDALERVQRAVDRYRPAGIFCRGVMLVTERPAIPTIGVLMRGGGPDELWLA